MTYDHRDTQQETNMINTCSKEIQEPFRDSCSYMVTPRQWSDKMPICTTWDSPCFSNVDIPGR